MLARNGFSADRPTFALGIDLGASKIAGVLLGGDGIVVASRHQGTQPEQGADRVIERIAAMVQSLQQETPAGGLLLGLGVGFPGQVDRQAGIVRGSVNLGWEAVPLVERLHSCLGEALPIWLEIDANTSAIGEFLFGAGRDCADFVYLGLGTGLGGAAFVGGHLLEGASHYALEVGHLTLDPGGPRCACGKRGCAEKLVSGPGLAGLAQKYLAESSFVSTLTAEEARQPARILAAARQGDRLAQAAIAELGRGLGQVMAICASVLNPARILVGGGLGSAAFDLLLPPALAEMRARTLVVIHEHLEILPAGCPSPAVGAAALAWYSQLERR